MQLASKIFSGTNSKNKFLKSIAFFAVAERTLKMKEYLSKKKYLKKYQVLKLNKSFLFIVVSFRVLSKKSKTKIVHTFKGVKHLVGQIKKRGGGMEDLDLNWFYTSEVSH